MELNRCKLHIKTRGERQIKVLNNWMHTEKVSPAFRRLMVLLLNPRPETSDKRGVSDEDR